MDTEKLVRLNFPPPAEDADRDFQAGYIMPLWELEGGCIRQVQIVDVTDSNTVSVLYDGVTYDNVPVVMHTDYGTRRRQIENTPDESLEGYFQNSAFQFVCGEGDGFYYYSGGGWSSIQFAVAPKALAVVYMNEDGSKTVSSIFGIVQHLNAEALGSLSTAVPSGANPGGWPTYRPMFAVELEKYTWPSTYTGECFLFDPVAGTIATIPNETYTALVAADFGEDLADYHWFLRGAIKPNPSISGTVTKRDYGFGHPPGFGDYGCYYRDGSSDSFYYESPYYYPDHNPPSITHLKQTAECFDAYFEAYNGGTTDGTYGKTYIGSMHDTASPNYSFGYPLLHIQSAEAGVSGYIGSFTYSTSEGLTYDFNIEVTAIAKTSDTSTTPYTRQATASFVVTDNGRELATFEASHTWLPDALPGWGSGDQTLNLLRPWMNPGDLTVIMFNNNLLIEGKFTLRAAYSFMRESTWNGASYDVVYSDRQAHLNGGVSLTKNIPEISTDGLITTLRNAYDSIVGGTGYANSSDIDFSVHFMFVPYNPKEAGLEI